MSDQLEMTLAYHCAPSLAGIKPANLVSWKPADFPGFYQRLAGWNKQLNNQDIFFHPILSCSRRTMVLVYRKSELTACLSNYRAQELLKKEGYPLTQGLTAILTHLEKRMEEYNGFPHEIGIFLGYPIDDVLGYIKYKGKNCKLSGYWKVYSDEAEAKALFRRFNKCRAALCKRVGSGKTIVQIFQAA